MKDKIRKDNKKCWNNNAKIYDLVMKKDSKTYIKIYEKIAIDVKNKTVLEVGTGTGNISLNIAKYAKSVCAIDFSKKMIEQARKKENPYKVNFEIADATKLPYKNESFDVIIISNCLHIMLAPQKVLAEIYRVLKNEGVLFAPNFCHKGQVVAKIAALTNVFTGFKTFNSWTPNEYITFLENNNFSVLEHEIYSSRLKLTMTKNKKKEFSL